MTFTEFKELGLFPKDISQTDLADLMGVSKQSISYYVSNGIGLDKVEAFAEKIGCKIRLNIDTPQVEHYDQVFNAFLKKISKAMEQAMTLNHFTLKEMAKKTRLPQETIQSVLDCKCTSFKIIMIVCTIIRLDVKIEYKGGNPFSHGYNELWDNSRIISDIPLI